MTARGAAMISSDVPRGRSAVVLDGVPARVAYAWR